MRIACSILKAFTHAEHVTLITFPLQQWLNERASMLRYAVTACMFYLLTTVSWNQSAMSLTFFKKSFQTSFMVTVMCM